MTKMENNRKVRNQNHFCKVNIALAELLTVSTDDTDMPLQKKSNSINRRVPTCTYIYMCACVYMSDIYMSNRLSKVFTLIAASIGREYCQIADALQAKKPLKNRWENGLARLSDLRALTLKVA